MESLSRHIRQRLDNHKSCTILDKELAQMWPGVDQGREKRFAQIRAFAKFRGWSATILDPGIRVTFRKAAAREATPASARTTNAFR